LWANKNTGNCSAHFYDENGKAVYHNNKISLEDWIKTNTFIEVEE